MESQFPGENCLQLRLPTTCGDWESELKVSGNSSILIKSGIFNLKTDYICIKH